LSVMAGLAGTKPTLRSSDGRKRNPGSASPVIPGCRFASFFRELNQPAAIGDAAQMIIGVAEGVLDHRQPFEIVADLGFHGHADSAMKLDRLLADKFPGFADLNLRRRHRGRPLL